MKLKDAVQSVYVNTFTIPCISCGREIERSKNFKAGRCFECKKLQRKERELRYVKARQLKGNKL
jgi:hypothetical protein